MRRRSIDGRSAAHGVSSLAEGIGTLLRRAQPFAYCDDCLATYFAVSRPSARHATRKVAATEGFIRQRRRCRGCQRVADVTWRVRPLSVFAAAARNTARRAVG